MNAYTAKNYSKILGIKGFSDALLENHFKLYEGYVANFNKLNDILIEMGKNDKFGTPEFAELNRRLGWEFNGMRLHELYFSNMTKEKNEIDQNGNLAKKIEGKWGSIEKWEKDFVSIGGIRGIGWVVLYDDKESGHLFNVWVNEHDMGHLAGASPLLVMDVFEHAFMLDYGMNRGAYINSFKNAIDWAEIENRLI